MLILDVVVGCCIYSMGLVLLLNGDSSFCGTMSPLFDLIVFWLLAFLDAFADEMGWFRQLRRLILHVLALFLSERGVR